MHCRGGLMCSIVGVICNHNSYERTYTVGQLFDRSKQRGRDSGSLVAVQGSYPAQRLTSADEIRAKLQSPYYLAVGNLRGEPAPEWVQEKTEADVQPFVSPSGRWIFTHNGTIANDHQIYELGSALERPTQIDSYAIGIALDDKGFEETVTTILIGSFAIIAMDRDNNDGVLYWAANYKPLFLLGSPDGSQFLLGSQRSFFDGMYDPVKHPSPVELGPYKYG